MTAAAPPRPPNPTPSTRAFSNNVSAAGPSNLHIAYGWATLARNFTDDPRTRVHTHAALLEALFDASGENLSPSLLRRSGLYQAVRDLGRKNGAGEMFEAVHAARTLADWWKGKYGDELEM